MNTFLTAGRIGKSAETRQVGETSVTSFSLAADKRGKGGAKETQWYDCSVWGERGVALQQYLTKGTALAVSGEGGVRVYVGKDGAPAAALTVKVTELTLLGGGEKAEAAPQRAPAGRAPARQAPAAAPSDDDIPF